MEIHKYELFADVADTKNFTRSGERMGYTQPGVSHILKAMETEIGFPLFIRTKQGVSLTPNAEVILPIVRSLLSVNEQLEQTIHALNGLETGHLTIAAFASIARNWLPSIICIYQKENPGIEIELMEGGTDDIVGWVEDSRADFGLLSRRHTSPLEWISLYEDPLMAILPRDYPVENRTSFPIREMEGKPFIISAEGVDYDIRYALQSTGVTPYTHFPSKDDLVITSMVSSGLGVSILPRLVFESKKEDVLALPLEPRFSRELGIGIRSRKSLSPAARRFVEVIQKTLPGLHSQ